MNFETLAKDILKLIGGKKNVAHVEHCMTRIRLNVKDESIIQTEKIKALDGVMGVAKNGGQYQIIIGNDVRKAYQALIKEGDLENAAKDQIGDEKQEYKNVMSKIFDIISGIFVPIIPVIAGAGMLKGLLAILTLSGLVSTDSDTYKFIEALASASFIFLPMLLAFSSAVKFKTNPYVAVVLGGFMLHPAFTVMRTEEITSLDVFNLPIRLIDYSSSVLPIILAVWLLSYIERVVRKIVPSSLKIVIEAMIILLIAAPITMAFIGPLGTVVGNVLSDSFNYVYNVSGLFAGMMLGAFFSLIVITGMHYGFTPLILGGIAKNGFDLIKPIMLMANMGQAGATFAVFLKTKNKKMKSLAGASAFSALLGITEPAIYGVTMKLKRPFIGAAIGGATGGAIAGIFKVKAYGWAVAGLPAIPLFIGDTFIYFIVAVVASFGVALVATLLLGFEDAAEEVPTKVGLSPAEEVKVPEQHAGSSDIITSPLSGVVKSLKEVSDPVFAEEVMGKGIAIEPEQGQVVSPINGTVAHLAVTKHAIGIISESGAELLIHIGIDTVQLNGKHFTTYVQAGDEVTAGQLLIEFDEKEIRKAGFQTVTPVLLINHDRFEDLIAPEAGHKRAGDPLFTLTTREQQLII
ncbi:beta-glucoside-specific PTS transporter subunit IIABC [Priestia megaterium]|uniref:beta-glucoside-specific PTS transporter subunit IIABC n=1 Tax=Priestia megaterium TaxID=1404 RepID=UPI002E210851|nr:beta-glucoside-specific PTS transporter subunit IIABC [Priestia megaterium]MED4116275.1 beta-glucoside-specific PTS transporter subunit IIABC [Priestia megaterium]